MKKCEHKVIRRNAITGDPLKIDVICIKCGEKAEFNTLTQEIR